jgi:hypothetical protein
MSADISRTFDYHFMLSYILFRHRQENAECEVTRLFFIEVSVILAIY